MRSLALAAVFLCGAACIPFEPYWWIQDARMLGMRMSVVEPGGYSTLLDVPPGQRRATPLPLDTVELEWFVAAAEGVEVQPPIWVACSTPGCIDEWYRRGYDLRDCPQPLPFTLFPACRLGEGERIRVGFAGAYTVHFAETFLQTGLTILAIGSRTPEVSSETCLDRYAGTPHTGLEQCLIGRNLFVPGPMWAVLPFSPELAMLPPEFVAQQPDTHPDITGFRVTRARGVTRRELLAQPGDTVPIEPGERITVLPLFIAGGEQPYVVFDDDDDGDPLTPPETHEFNEFIQIDGFITALVDQFEDPDFNVGGFGADFEITWVVTDHPEPATLYVTARDDRAGRAFAALHFAPTDP